MSPAYAGPPTLTRAGIATETVADSCGPPQDIFSLYINDIGEHETINGVPITEAQIAAGVAEAEAGYDVAALKKRGRGTQVGETEPSQVVALRLTLEEIAVIDERAEREGTSRSEVIREPLHLSAATSW